MFFRLGAILGVLVLAASTAARGADDDGILEGELLQIDPAAGNLLVAETTTGEPIVVGLHDTAIFLQGEQPIGLGRVPLRSDVRVLFQLRHGRRVADRIDVFPHSVPDIRWSPRHQSLRAQTYGGGRPAPRLTSSEAAPPATPEGKPICPPGTEYVAGFSSASSPGTVMPGGGTAVGSSHSTSTPGEPVQPAQPPVGCVPVDPKPAPYVLP